MLRESLSWIKTRLFFPSDLKGQETEGSLPSQSVWQNLESSPHNLTVTPLQISPLEYRLCVLRFRHIVDRAGAKSKLETDNVPENTSFEDMTDALAEAWKQVGDAE
jgi:hypothetical protein